MNIRCRQVLELPPLQGVTVVAGHAGLDRPIRRVHLEEPGDSCPRVRPDEILLTGGHNWPDTPSEQESRIRSLHERAASALAVGLGRRWASIPPAICGAAEHHGLPLLAIPPGLTFTEVCEAIQGELLRQRFEIIERSEQILRNLTESALEARDLQHITGALARILQKSVTVEDPDYRLLAHAEWGSAMDPVRESTLRLGKTPDEVINRCYSQGIIQSLRTSPRPFLFQGFPDLGMKERIICPVRLSGEMVAYVDILSGDEPITELDMRVAQHAATVLALHILRQQSVAQVEVRVRFAFVDAVLSGDVRTNSPEFLERARLLGFDPQLSYAAAIVAPTGETRNGRILQGREDFYRREQRAQAVRSALSLCNLPNLITCSLNQVIFLMPTANQTGPELRKLGQRVYRRICDEQPAQPVVMACGLSYQGVEGIRRSYAEASSLVAASTAEPGLRWYEDEVVLRLLEAVPNRELLQDLHRVSLGRVLAHDNSEILYETLRELVRCDFRQVQAARALHVHRNTLLYRIRVLEQLLEGAFNDPELKLRLQLAFAAERVLQGRNP